MVPSHLQPNPEEIKLSVTIKHTSIAPDGKNAFEDAIQCNPVLNKLMHTIIDGWTDDINDVSKVLCR